MNRSVNENKSLYILLGIIIVLLLAVLYYYVIFPKIERERSLTQSIQTVAAENKEMSRKIEQLTLIEDEEDNYFELRRKLPHDRQLKQLLLSIQQVELMSDANILSIHFNNYDSLVSQSSLGDLEAADVGAGEGEQENKDEEELSEQSDETDMESLPKTILNRESMPDALKLLSFSVVVEVQDYDHLLSFIQQIEQLERVKKIESIQFGMAGEEDFAVDDFDEAFTASIQITTFYAEDEEK